MKPRLLLSIFMIVVVIMFVVGSCATSKKTVSQTDLVETLSGTWVNHDNPVVRERYKDGFFHFQKVIRSTHKGVDYYDAEVEYYHAVEDSDFAGHAQYTIKDSWVDRRGNTYCQVFIQFYTGSRVYALWKLDNTQNVFEENYYYWAPDEYPSKIIKHDVIEDNRYPTGNLYYNIFYRQE